MKGKIKKNIQKKSENLQEKEATGKTFHGKSTRMKTDKCKGENPVYKRKERKQVLKNACSVSRKCGGCLGQTTSYEEHLREKGKKLEQLLKPFGKPEKIIGMEYPYHYRNKVHAAFAYGKQGPYCGIYQEGTHKVVPVENCMIENEKASAIIQTIKQLLPSFKIKIFDEDNGYGLLRHVLVRTGHKSGEIMVVLVLSSMILPSKNNFVKALRKVHPEITTVIVNENYKKTSMILGDKEQVLYGKGFVTDNLCGKEFRISAKSFYQVNSVQTELLYEKAMEFAGLSGKETVLDTYCGIGTIGIIAADRAKKVIGVELNPAAVRDAVSNAKRNQIKNIDFYVKDASDFMIEVAENSQEKVDVVFMDPPRAGSDERFIEACRQLNPEKIVYISCNPVSLQRDLLSFTKKGYRVKRMVGVDLFPWTGHVECVVLMSKVG